MKYLLFLLPFTALALNPSAPVVRLNGGQIVEQRQTIPNRYGSTVNYQSVGEFQWFKDGWRQASISQVTNVTTIEIPEPIQRVAQSYVDTMQQIYGDGAHTNTEYTAEFVKIDLSLRSDITADTGLRLQTWYEILNTYWGRGEIWSFPYYTKEWYSTNVTEQWSILNE